MKTNYSKYTEEDFITDESFVAWCHQDSDNDFWLTMSQEESLADKINTAKSIVLRLHSPAIDVGTIDAATKTKLWERIDRSTPTKKISITRRLFAYTIGSVAACFLLFFAYNAIKGSKNITENVQTILASNALDNITLPDQSQVSIKQGSSISFDKSSFTSKRSIKLKGHAFFKVEKGSEFNVITEQGTVRVLGTSFDVVEDNNRLKVVCYTGKVEVISNGKKVILTSGEETDFDKSALKKMATLQGEMPGYISGKLTFNQTPLSEVIRIIEDEYKIYVKANKEIFSKTYSGVIYLNNLDNAMKSITWPYHLSYTKNGDVVTINKNEK